MMGMHFVVKLLLAVLFANINGCQGSFQFDLFEINRLSAYIITVNGTKAVDGPIKQHKGIHFTPDTDDIVLDNNNFAYIAHLIQNSNDFTFAVYFKIMSTKMNEHTYFPFFGMADSKMHRTYFSIGLESNQAFSLVEGKRIFNDKLDWTVNIEHYVATTKASTKTTLKLGDHLKLREWMTLMVRVRVDSVTVSLNCQDVVKGILKDGRVGRFSYDGKLIFSQIITTDGKKQYVGSMYEPQLINGQLAYDWYNPCTRDNTPSVIKPEPRPDEYNDSKFKMFQKMSQQDSQTPIVSCTDNTGKKHRSNGDPWIVNKCFKYKCVDGKIQVHYQCRNCADGDKVYKSNETWIDKMDPCKQMRCIYGHYVETTRIICKTLTCPEDEQYLQTGACCKRCRDDDCTQKRKYYNSCEKKCSIGVKKCVVGTMKKACWCPENTALNQEETECIPTGECKCKVSDIIYLPGQSIKKSLCSNCICSHGELTCFDTC